MLAALPIGVLLSLLAALQFQLSLLLRALLLRSALLILILVNTFAILPLLILLAVMFRWIWFLSTSRCRRLTAWQRFQIDTLAILLPSILLLRALLILILLRLILLRCALRLALPLLFGTLLTGLLLLGLALRLCLTTLLLLRGATLFLLGLTLRSSILFRLILSWLISLLSLAIILPAVFSTATAALRTCDVAGADQHCESKRCRRCEALVINFHLYTPLNLVAPLRLTRCKHWQAAFQR